MRAVDAVEYFALVELGTGDVFLSDRFGGGTVGEVAVGEVAGRGSVEEELCE